jgi:RimJ/RimL family protein N-acetyltransferase
VDAVLIPLDNGVTVELRPIRPDDKALLTEGMRRLSQRSSYQRFLGAKSDLSASELRYLTEVDFRDHVAFVAVLADAPDVVVAVGRWVRLADDPEVAEIAFVVADDLQRSGLGTALGEALAQAARERGVKRFVATMLPDNLAAHRLFARLAQERESARSGPLEELRGAIRPAALRRGAGPRRSAPSTG